MEGLFAKLVVGFSLALVMSTGLWLLTSRRTRLIEGSDVDVGAWRGWALANGFNFTGSDEKPHMTGAHKGVPFRFACEIRKIRINTRGGATMHERQLARTHIRVSMRTDLPPDLFMHPMPRIARWLNKLMGGKTITTVPALDDMLAVETSEAEKARSILLHPDVLPELARVLQILPEAVIDARSVEASFPSMPTLGLALDRYVETLANFVLAVQKVAPGAAIEAPVLAAEPGNEPVQVLSSAQLPRRRPVLAHALSKVNRDHLEAGILSVEPLEYEMLVLHSKEAVDQRDRKTGGKALVGEVMRSVWRMELLFDPEDNEAVEALKPRAQIEGMLEVISADPKRKKLLARSLTPPMPASNPPKG